MTKTFTQSDLIRFIYQETTEEEGQEISRGLASDPALNRQYRELLLSTKKLDKAMLEPSKDTVDKIMGHARSQSVKH